MCNKTSMNFLVAGVSEIDITPAPGKQLAGYFEGRLAVWTRDPIFVKALWLENNGIKMLILSYDLVVTEAAVSDPVREALAKEFDMPPLNIATCATHTHTAPSFSKSLPTGEDAEYVALLIESSIKAAKLAEANKFKATVHHGKTTVQGYSTNRLFRKADGSEIKYEKTSDVVGKAGPVDEELQVVVLRDSAKKVRVAMVNFACHSDSVGGGSADFYSADWPGETAKVFRQIYGEDVPCILLHGCAGDINPILEEQGYFGGMQNSTKAKQIGRAVAGAAVYALERAEPENNLTLHPQSAMIEIPYYTRDKKLETFIDALRKKENKTQYEKCFIERFDNWAWDRKSIDILLQVFKIGEIALVFMPGELFCNWGLEIKRYSPTPKTMVVELSDKRNISYVPTTDQAKRGAYGSVPVMSRWACDDAGRMMTEKAIEMLYNK